MPDKIKPATQRGRPKVHKEEWTKTNVVLLDSQIAFLDTLSVDIRYRTKNYVSRSDLIRALIAALEESKLDLSEIDSEAGLKSLLVDKLTGKP